MEASVQLLNDFNRLQRWAFGDKSPSPELKNAAQRLIDWFKFKVPRAAPRLNRTNIQRQRDAQQRRDDIRSAVHLERDRLACEYLKADKSTFGSTTDAMKQVARDRAMPFWKIKKIYYAKIRTQIKSDT